MIINTKIHKVPKEESKAQDDVVGTKTVRKAIKKLKISDENLREKTKVVKPKEVSKSKDKAKKVKESKAAKTLKTRRQGLVLPSHEETKKT